MKKENGEGGPPAHPPRLGDFGRLKFDAPQGVSPRNLCVNFLFSKNGVPSIETSSKPRCFTQNHVAEDFLWINNVPGYPTSPFEQATWWQGIAASAQRNRARWSTVQYAMSRSSCLLYVKAKAGKGWTESAPESYGRAGSGSGSGGRRRSDRGKRVSSGLRNEVPRD